VGSVWLAAGFFALAAAAHQGWSATMYTVVSDIFPKNAVASVVGFGGTLADHPAGTWSAPLLLQEGKGLIYPCPLWDDDGQAYLVHAYAFSRSGLKHALRVRPMAPDGSRLLGAGHIVFHDPARQPIIEGPKFLKKDGWHYISAPAGGVETGWQVALRSRRIYGPYEDRIVLQQGGTPVNGLVVCAFSGRGRLRQNHPLAARPMARRLAGHRFVAQRAGYWPAGSASRQTFGRRQQPSHHPPNQR
jgi:hypothetical protein